MPKKDSVSIRLKYYINHPKELTEVDTLGRNVLQQLVITKQWQLLRQILTTKKLIRSPKLLQHKDSKGLTLLHYLVDIRNPSYVSEVTNLIVLLLQNWPQLINSVNNEKDSPLHLAIIAEDYERVDLICKHCAQLLDEDNKSKALSLSRTNGRIHSLIFRSTMNLDLSTLHRNVFATPKPSSDDEGIEEIQSQFPEFASRRDSLTLTYSSSSRTSLTASSSSSDWSSEEHSPASSSGSSVRFSFGTGRSSLSLALNPCYTKITKIFTVLVKHYYSQQRNEETIRGIQLQFNKQYQELPMKDYNQFFYPKDPIHIKILQNYSLYLTDSVNTYRQDSESIYLNCLYFFDELNTHCCNTLLAQAEFPLEMIAFDKESKGCARLVWQLCTFANQTPVAATSSSQASGEKLQHSKNTWLEMILGSLQIISLEQALTIMGRLWRFFNSSQCLKANVVMAYLLYYCDDGDLFSQRAKLILEDIIKLNVVSDDKALDEKKIQLINQQFIMLVEHKHHYYSSQLVGNFQFCMKFISTLKLVENELSFSDVLLSGVNCKDSKNRQQIVMQLARALQSISIKFYQQLSMSKLDEENDKYKDFQNKMNAYLLEMVFRLGEDKIVDGVILLLEVAHAACNLSSDKGVIDTNTLRLIMGVINHQMISRLIDEGALGKKQKLLEEASRITSLVKSKSFINQIIFAYSSALPDFPTLINQWTLAGENDNSIDRAQVVGKVLTQLLVTINQVVGYQGCEDLNILRSMKQYQPCPPDELDNLSYAIKARRFKLGDSGMMVIGDLQELLNKEINFELIYGDKVYTGLNMIYPLHVWFESVVIVDEHYDKKTKKGLLTQLSGLIERCIRLYSVSDSTYSPFFLAHQKQRFATKIDSIPQAASSSSMVVSGDERGESSSQVLVLQ